MNDRPCPCGSEIPLKDCCSPYISGQASAPTAEALMRSRFTAYALQSVDYLLETLHQSQRRRGEKLQLRRSLEQTRWLRLQVIDTVAGGVKNSQGEVEFVAVYGLVNSQRSLAGLLSQTASQQAPQSVGQMHERSRFVREDDRWFYVDGDQLPDYRPPRNQPCWCGSGKKFKHCHG